MHEDIEVMFSGEKYFHQEVHGRRSGDMPSRRWNKPSIMIIGEANYSNAHGTPLGLQAQKTSANSSACPCPAPCRRSTGSPFRIRASCLVCLSQAIVSPDGSYLENQQLEPDIKVANDAETVVSGVDQQLEAAVKALLNDIDSAKK